MTAERLLAVTGKSLGEKKSSSGCCSYGLPKEEGSNEDALRPVGILPTAGVEGVTPEGIVLW